MKCDKIKTVLIKRVLYYMILFQVLSAGHVFLDPSDKIDNDTTTCCQSKTMTG